MKLSIILDPRFTQAIQKIIPIQMPLLTAIKVKNLIKEINKLATEYDAARIELVNKYGTKDADGKLAVDENGNVRFAEEASKLLMKELSELLDVAISLTKIPAAELKNLNLSVDELSLLEEIFSF